MNRIILQPTGKETINDFKNENYTQWAEKDIPRYRKIWEDSVGDTVLLINKGKIFAIAKIEELYEFDGDYRLGYYWNDNIKFVDISLSDINNIAGYKSNYSPRNYMLIKDNIDDIFEFLSIYKYLDLIEEFKLDMQDGKEFKIRTISDNSSFSCYMTENSNTLKIRTSTGNERYTAFINLERYFKNEKVKDEVNYVKAICEWLKKINQYDDVNNIHDVHRKRKSLEIEESKKVYPRDEQEKKEALILANYKCELEEMHTTFISKYTDENYVEGHHLIPISQYAKFENDVDVKANIVF